MKEYNKNSFCLKNGLGIGENYPIRINLNFGLNNIDEYEKEKVKIDTLLLSEHTRPDIVMDLSTIKIGNPLYRRVITF